MNPNNLKSERSAKILMTKIERRYKAAHGELGAVLEARWTHGCTDDTFTQERAARDKMSAIVDEMRVLSDAAKARGWWVKGSTLRWMDSPTAELVRNNID